jgi:hypothetical protein
VKISPELGFHVQDRLGEMLRDPDTTADRTWLLLTYLSLSKVIRGTQVSTLKVLENVKNF